MKKVLLMICSTLLLVGCGGGGMGGGSNPPSSTLTIYVTVSPSAQTNIDAGESLKFSASVENDSRTKGVTWSCSVTGSAAGGCGTFTNSTTSEAIYNAPSVVSASLGITVTATSVADTTKSSSAKVLVCPLPEITTTTLAEATPNAGYSATLQATGGVAPLTWFVASGSLPTGLSLASSGTLTGTATVPGNYTFTVQVTDASTAPEHGPATAEALESITVATVEKISSASLPPGAVGVAYVTSIEASGGTLPYAWSMVAGSLPSSLNLDPASGVISGTPTTPGNFSFTVQAKDSSPTPQAVTRILTLTIAAPGPLTVLTSALTNATPNTNYNATLQATGGVAPLTWTLVAGSLPTGLSLAASGAISGDPTVPGSYNFTVQVSDSSTALEGGPVTAQAQLSLTVVTTVGITTSSLPAGAAGVPYIEQVTASGGTAPYTWTVSAGSLPLGLVLQPTSGAISGSPAFPGNYTFTVAAQDSSPTPQATNQAFIVVIGSPAPLAIATSALLDGTVNTPYTAMAAATGGTPPYRWALPAGGLPFGMGLSGTTGTIAGTPTSTGTESFTLEVTDSSATPQTATQTLSLAVNDAAQACTNSGNNALLNGSYAFSLSGFNDVGFITVVGAFTADGTGRITAGEADVNGVLGAQHGNMIPSTSGYSVGPDNRGCATLATSFGTFSTHFVLGSIASQAATAGRMIEWDSASTSAYIASGQILRQDLSSIATGLTGSYVYRTIGWDPSSQGGREVCLGVVSAAGNTFSAMEQDCNDAWNIVSAAIPTVAGTYTAFDSSGRGTGILTENVGASNFLFYRVSSSRLLAVNSDSGPFASGEWVQQAVPAGGMGFTQASLDGNIVFYLSGLSMQGTASAVSFETANADGNSALSINFFEDRSGAMQISSPLSCTYAVEPGGRVILSSDTQACGSNIPALYLTGVNAGFIMDAAPGVDSGTIEPQAAGPFSNASLDGNFFAGTEETVIQRTLLEVDPVTIGGNGNMSGSADLSSMTAQDEGASFPAATCTVNPDGTFSLSSAGGAVSGVIISSTRFVMFSAATLATPIPTLLVMQK